MVQKCERIIFSHCDTPLVALAVFASYVLSGHDLEVSKALTALALFELLRFPLFMLPGIINRIVEAGVSLKRLRSFLLCEEYRKIDEGTLRHTGVRMVNTSFAYETARPLGKGQGPMEKELTEKNWELSLLKSQLDEAEAKIRQLSRVQDDKAIKNEAEAGGPMGSLLCLKRINLEVLPGELIAVVGGVGSGKSSLLNAILGEVRQLSGTTEARGKLAYFSQNPFIMNASLQANVLFSHVEESIDEDRYKKALAACALTHDLGTYTRHEPYFSSSFSRFVNRYAAGRRSNRDW